jgi:2C-methyl-D-erythritol 2,4-cyclodiphosphate synthase
MRAVVAATLDIPPGAVSVKASTGNLDGAEGAGRAISAIALATIEPTR